MCQAYKKFYKNRKKKNIRQSGKINLQVYFFTEANTHTHTHTYIYIPTLEKAQLNVKTYLPNSDDQISRFYLLCELRHIPSSKKSSTKTKTI